MDDRSRRHPHRHIEEGKVLGQLVLPEVAANLAFAEQGKVAYITATSSIYKLALRTPGTMPLYQR